jgi:hypothetical protein
MSDIALVSSSEGQKVIALIKARLEARLIELMEEDPRSCALIDVLKEMGVKYHSAQAAVKRLAAMYIADQE